MSRATISFLSTRGRAMNIDLKLIQDYLALNLSDVTFEYYLKNTATKVPAANKQLEEARLSFCNNTRNIICMDPSIPVKLSPALPEERRLLTLVPYDYLFNEYLKFTEDPELAHKKTFFRCTHVLSGSPFFSNFLKNFYEFENATFLDDICLPLAWDITSKESKENVRNNLEYLYPEAKGKKILTILTVNQTAPEEMTELFSDLDLKKFLNEIGDNWFLLTNNINLLEMSGKLPFSYSKCFGYIKGVFGFDNLLYFSDMLVTNSSKHACTFASENKPVYYLNYGKKHFGRYMKQYYPDLYLETAGELMTLDYDQTELSEEESRFCQEFAYNTTQNPFSSLKNLFSQETTI